MRHQINFRLLGIVFIALVLSACGGDDETPAPEAAVPGQAVINSLEVVTLETFPVQVQATVGGNLTDNCTSVAAINVQRVETTFTLDVQTAFNDTGACIQAPIPFSNPVSLDVLNLPAGTYNVNVGVLSESFTLAVNNIAPQPEQQPAVDGNNSGLTTDVTSALPGQAVALTGQGFGANATVTVGIGNPGGDISPIGNVQANADGNFATQVNLPANAAVGESWHFSALLDGVPTYTNPIVIVEAGQTEQPPQAEADNEETSEVAANNLFEQTNLYFIALEDNGQSGSPVGCGDSIVPVTIDIEPTNAPMTAAYNTLFGIKDQFIGEAGLYNALYQSNLTLVDINIVNRQATVNLNGNIALAGACDSPRVLAQLEQVALQYDSVGKVTIFLNGRLLTMATEPGGRG